MKLTTNHRLKQINVWSYTFTLSTPFHGRDIYISRFSSTTIKFITPNNTILITTIRHFHYDNTNGRITRRQNLIWPNFLFKTVVLIRPGISICITPYQYRPLFSRQEGESRPFIPVHYVPLQQPTHVTSSLRKQLTLHLSA